MKRFNFAFTLAEVFSSHFKGQRRVAFTLAEVLITLGIIGVVAAITMPTLIQNYKKTVYVNQLKKSVSTLQQGFQKMMADEGVDKLTDTTLWSNYYGNSQEECDYDTYESDPVCKTFLDGWKNYFSIVDISKPEKNYSLSSANYYIKFADGLWIGAFMPMSTEDNGELVIDIEFDTNGLKGPNKPGRDMFSFIIRNNGKFDNYENSAEDCIGANGTSSGFELRCGTRIMENGWVMDY